MDLDLLIGSKHGLKSSNGNEIDDLDNFLEAEFALMDEEIEQQFKKPKLVVMSPPKVKLAPSTPVSLTRDIWDPFSPYAPTSTDSLSNDFPPASPCSFRHREGSLIHSLHSYQKSGKISRRNESRFLSRLISSLSIDPITMHVGSRAAAITHMALDTDSDILVASTGDGRIMSFDMEMFRIASQNFRSASSMNSVIAILPSLSQGPQQLPALEQRTLTASVSALKKRPGQPHIAVCVTGSTDVFLGSPSDLASFPNCILERVGSDESSFSSGNTTLLFSSDPSSHSNPSGMASFPSMPSNATSHSSRIEKVDANNFHFCALRWKELTRRRLFYFFTCTPSQRRLPSLIPQDPPFRLSRSLEDTKGNGGDVLFAGDGLGRVRMWRLNGLIRGGLPVLPRARNALGHLDTGSTGSANGSDPSKLKNVWTIEVGNALSSVSLYSGVSSTQCRPAASGAAVSAAVQAFSYEITSSTGKSYVSAREAREISATQSSSMNTSRISQISSFASVTADAVGMRSVGGHSLDTRSFISAKTILMNSDISTNSVGHIAAAGKDTGSTRPSREVSREYSSSSDLRSYLPIVPRSVFFYTNNVPPGMLSVVSLMSPPQEPTVLLVCVAGAAIVEYNLLKMTRGTLTAKNPAPTAVSVFDVNAHLLAALRCCVRDPSHWTHFDDTLTSVELSSGFFGNSNIDINNNAASKGTLSQSSSRNGSRAGSRRNSFDSSTDNTRQSLLSNYFTVSSSNLTGASTHGRSTTTDDSAQMRPQVSWNDISKIQYPGLLLMDSILKHAINVVSRGDGPSVVACELRENGEIWVLLDVGIEVYINREKQQIVQIRIPTFRNRDLSLSHSACSEAGNTGMAASAGDLDLLMVNHLDSLRMEPLRGHFLTLESSVRVIGTRSAPPRRDEVSRVFFRGSAGQLTHPASGLGRVSRSVLRTEIVESGHRRFENGSNFDHSVFVLPQIGTFVEQPVPITSLSAFTDDSFLVGDNNGVISLARFGMF